MVEQGRATPRPKFGSLEEKTKTPTGQFTPTAQRLRAASRGGRGGGGGVSTPSRALPSIPTGVTTVTRPRRGGGKIIVTRSGLVTIRDSRGKLIERFQTSEAEARRFIAAPPTQSERIIQTFRKQGREAFLGKSGEIISINPITGRKEVIAGRQIVAKVPISAKVSIPGIIAVRRKRERLETRERIVSQVIGRIEAKRLQDKLDKIRGKKGFTIAGLITADTTKKIPKTFKGLKALAEKKLAELQERLRGERTAETREVEFRRKKKVLGKGEEVFRGAVVLGLMGIGRGVVGGLQFVVSPFKFLRSQFESLKPQNFKATFKGVGEDFAIDPVGTVAEFWAFSKTLKLLGSVAKNTPLTRFVREELYIQAQPRVIRPFVRAIIKSAKVQERINPTKIKSLKGVNFAEIKSLTRIEAKAIAKTLRQTDSVVFGSTASRTLSKNRTPLPKDVDIATANIITFNRQFINNLPKNARGNYALIGQKIIRKSTRQAIMDVKPLDRLIPQRNLFGRGKLPVVGYVKRLTRVKGKLLPRIKSKPATTALTVPTQKIVTVKGIRLTGFSEQVTRKALGTLQVLIERSTRRAKDPQSFLIGLKVQLEALRRTKPKTPIGRIRLKGKIKTLSNAIKILQSKEFARLLERKVPGITKNFPLLKEINVGQLKKININKVNQIVKARLKKVTKITKKQITNLNNQRRVLQRKIKRLGDTKVEIRLKDEFRIKLRKIESKLGIIRKVQKITKPIGVAVRKGKRIIRISGEAISRTNSRAINNVRNTMGNLGIRVSFAKVNTRARIRNITTPISRRLNINIRLLRRQVRISSNKITRPILITLNNIRTILGNLNIRLRFAKLKVGQALKGKIAKARVPIRKGVRAIKLTKERVNVSTRRFIRKTETSLGNVNIRLKFAKFRAKARVTNISLSVQRKVNIRILRMKRRIRLSKANINTIVRRGVNRINTLLKKFNYKIRVESIKVKAVVRVALRKAIRPTKRILVISKERLSSFNSRVINNTRNQLGNIGIRVSFAKFRTKVRIRNITSIASRGINRNILLIRRSLRLSRNKITRPIISKLNTIKRLLGNFNIKIRFAKLKVGTRIGEIKRIVAKPIRKVKGLIRISGERLSSINTRVVTNVRTKLGNAGIKVSFIKFNARARIINITSIARGRINTNILLIRRSLRLSKNKITRPIISKLNTIKRLFGNFNIRLKFIKFKVGQRIAPVKAAAIRIAKKPVRAVKRTKLKIFNNIKRTVNTVNRTLGNLGIRIKFKKAQLRVKISNLTTPIERLIDRNIRALRRELIKSRGKTNSKIRLLIKRINRLIPIEIKIIKPGVIKKAPVSKRIRLKKEVKKSTPTLIKKLKRPDKVISPIRRPKKIKTSRLAPSRLRPSKIPSILRPSIIPSRLPSRLAPSKIPSKIKVSRLPSALRSLSRFPSVIPSFISLLPSRLPSRIPSRLRPSRLPSRIPSRLVPSKIPKVRPSKLLELPFREVPVKEFTKLDVKLKRRLNKLAGKVIQSQPFVYLNDLFSAIYGIEARPNEKAVFLRVGRVFTGTELRPLLPRTIRVGRKTSIKRIIMKAAKSKISNKNLLRLRVLMKRLRRLRKMKPRNARTRARRNRMIKKVQIRIKRIMGVKNGRRR